MKKVFIFILCFSFLSCEKEKFCWKCISTEIWRYNNGMSAVIKDTTDVCDKTEADIQKIQKDGTYTTIGSSATISKTTGCIR